MRLLLGFVASAALAISPGFAKSISNAQVRKAMIADSIASYPGSCPCPYNADRAGRACGHRSAYSRPGGYSPICYVRDVTAAMIADYRSRHDR